MFRLLLLSAPLLLVASSLLAQPSWKDLSMQMMGQGKLDSARMYLEKWLEADPGDESSWYNLACVYALQGQTAQALDAWEQSVATGWRDTEHPLRDPDLESIRPDPRFAAALEKVEANLAARGPANYVRRFLETSTVGTYVVLLPENYESSGRSYPICVILHGSGSTELAHGRLADRFGRENVIYVVPRALQVHTSAHLGTGEIGYTAWTPDRMDSTNPLYTRGAPMYAEWIMKCVDDVQQNYRTTGDAISILGHSQGAAFSYITAALYPERVQRIYSYAGYFPDDYRTDQVLDALRENNVSITLAHGSSDNVVSPDQSKEISALLAEHGVDATLTLYPETAHGISPDVLAAMTAWLTGE